MESRCSMNRYQSLQPTHARNFQFPNFELMMNSLQTNHYGLAKYKLYGSY